MPTFDFRLEAQDGSGHYRQGAGSFESEEDARAYLEEKEQGAAMYRLDSDELAEFEAEEEAAEGDGKPASAAARSRLALHRQAKPYKLVKLTERKED